MSNNQLPNYLAYNIKDTDRVIILEQCYMYLIDRSNLKKYKDCIDKIIKRMNPLTHIIFLSLIGIRDKLSLKEAVEKYGYSRARMSQILYVESDRVQKIMDEG